MKPFFRHAIAVLALTFPAVVFADVTGTPTLSANSNLNLDTGATGSSGGDLAWNGTSFNVVGSAKDADLASTLLGSEFNGMSGYNSLVQSGATLISTYAGVLGSSLGSSAITPAANDILIVKTNGGNYAAVLVNTVGGGSISLQFHTFTSSTSTPPPASGPTITGVVNNYSNIVPGLPSYGIAPGSVFALYGTGMSSSPASGLQSLSAPLPLTLDGTTISVTVNGKTTQPAMYYASPTQLAAVLPSTTPAGTGTITVTYNNQTSNAFAITVPASAFGIDTLYQTGAGGIVATVGSNVVLPTASASPGEVVTIWGSGLGADTANDDRTYPAKQDNLQAIDNVQVYIGGIQVIVAYAGRSQYPGLDQVNVTLPTQAAGLQTGCEVSVVVVASNKSSNFGTLPINPGGGICVDSATGLTGTDIGQLGSETTVRTGIVALTQTTSPSDAIPSTPQTSYTAFASFQSETGASYVSGGSFTTLGSCVVSSSNAVSTVGNFTSNGLDAGTPITLTGGGLSVSIPEFSVGGNIVKGDYFSTLTSALSGGTAYTFAGPGGKDVGSFNATLTFPIPLNWTNESSISAVTEAQGQLITWTGGATGTFVEIGGSSTSTTGSVSVSFICLAPVSAGQFTIPSYVLLSLPPGSGDLSVANYSNLASFTATGIDHGYTFAGVSTEENVTYK